MTVRALIELLMTFDAGAEVVLAGAPDWPMEHRIAGITTRDDFHGQPDKRYDANGARNDVVLVEGAWLRYGHRAVWDLARAAPRADSTAT